MGFWLESLTDEDIEDWLRERLGRVRDAVVDDCARRG